LAVSGPDGATAPWQEPGWLEDVTAWISARVELTEQLKPDRRHTKPWSAAARVRSATGRLWFKEMCPALAFEPALTEALARRAPDCMPEIVAVEGARMLIRHAGARFRELDDPASPAWQKVVARYAELQLELAPLAAGLAAPDSRPEVLAERFGRRVDPLIEALGDTIPSSLIHLGLHDKHVCRRNGRPVFIDWGDSAIAHPFCGLVETLHVLVNSLGARAGGREVLRVRDAYLEPWTAFAPIGDLRPIFTAANALGALCRVAAWERKLSSMPAAIRERYNHKLEKGMRIFAAAVLEPDALGAFAAAD
jgi:hypothetical protein